MFFVDNGTKPDVLATLAAAQAWAQARCQECLAIGEQHSQASGPFPERLSELQLTSRFLTDF